MCFVLMLQMIHMAMKVTIKAVNKTRYIDVKFKLQKKLSKTPSPLCFQNRIAIPSKRGGAALFFSQQTNGPVQGKANICPVNLI